MIELGLRQLPRLGELPELRRVALVLGQERVAALGIGIDRRIGLADQLVPEAEVLSAAKALAAEIAVSAPLAILSIRETLRRGLAEGVERATERELVEQEWQRRTDDFKEGVKATAERRLPDFRGK